MINLEKLKNNLIKQINSMDINEFYAFSNLLRDFGKDEIDTSCLFSCKQCQKIFRNCEDHDVCEKRFAMYAQMGND